MSKVLLGMSGGIDSSVSAWMLQRGGHEIVGVTLLFHERPAEMEKQAEAARICEMLGIEHHVVDAREAFKAQVKDFYASEYAAGRTPNPCSVCTAELKMPLLFEAADKYGCEKVATGHYAKVTQESYGVGLLPYQLCMSSDRHHEQTYLLFRLTQEQLSRMMFPLAQTPQPEVRRLSMQLGIARLAPLRPNFEICFLENMDHLSWLAEEGGVPNNPGEVVHVMHNTVLGEHDGLHTFDVGDGVGGLTDDGSELCVVAKDTATNRLLVGPESMALAETCLVKDVHWTSIEPITEKRSCKVRLNVGMKPIPCQLVPLKQGLLVSFNDSVRGLLSGQSAVFYSDTLVLGGGTIVG